ncbi:MAG: hypothetical protein NTY87_06045 [Planctomycetia bacterium]|nr:hypothetical protein [Planctomycetia bacterium]
MDLKLHRPHGVCAETGRAFAPAELFYSALVRSEGKLNRIDCCAEAWRGEAPHMLAWWRSLYPAAAAVGSTLAPPDVLLDVLENLADRPAEAPIRYLLALELLRRKVLRMVEKSGRPDACSDAATSHFVDLEDSRSPREEQSVVREELLLSCKKRDSDYRVLVVHPHILRGEGIEEQFSALLWSGAAA